MIGTEGVVTKITTIKLAVIFNIENRLISKGGRSRGEIFDRELV